MKQVLESKSDCPGCGKADTHKEFSFQSEKNDLYVAKYSRYIIDECKECRISKAKLI